MKTKWKIWLLIGLILVSVLVVLDARVNATATSSAQDKSNFIVSEPFTPSLSPAVRDLPQSAPSPLNREINPLKWLGDGIGLEGPSSGMDSLAANSVSGGITPNPLFTFEAQGNFNQYTPPDTDGDVGPNHYIQMVNVSFTIYDKAGNLLSGPTPYNALFAGAGGNCQADNSGDPVVLYDELSDRWILTQFAVSSGQDMCFAVSKTADPLGQYWLYEFGPLPDFPDYPKLGVWPDAYYMGTNSGFPNAYYAYAFDRVKMLAGQPATYQTFGGYPNFLMPADVDGTTPPADGTPGIFYTMLDGGYPNHPAGVDRISFYEFDVDWTTPANTTFSLVQEYPIADYNYTVCGFFVQNCVPQPGTSQTIDTLSYWPMFRLAYRNLGAYQAMVGNFTVDLDNTNKAAIRWFEMREEGSGWELYQEGTYAPDTDHRWMGSIAMDGSGNIAMGYSVSSTTTIPSIRYTTRLRNDPLGTLQSEATGWAGTGVQTGAVRWGDYSAMNVDPSDSCTFWYTTEYHETNDAGFSWNTRVIVFKLPECTGNLGPDFNLSVTPDNLDVCILSDGTTDVNLEWMEGYDVPVNLSALGVPAGYSADFSVNPVVSPTVTSQLTFLSTGAATAGSYQVDIVGIGTPTPTHTATLTLDLFDPITGVTTLLSPTDGETGISPAPTLTWEAVPGATSYGLEIATDAAFTNVVYSASGITDTIHTMTVALDELQTYYWHVKANNVCGDGSYSETFSFSTRAVPAILLVDDDDNGPNSRPIYSSALDTIGWTYDIWNTANSDNEPTATDLAPYAAVIWFTGDAAGGTAGPGDEGEAALTTWLENTQGCFFISSQDYFKAHGQTDFMTNYLGVATITEGNGDYSQVTGQGAVYSALGERFLSYDTVDISDAADWVTPDGTAEIGLLGNNGHGAALDKDAGYKTSFWAFPFEALYGPQNRRNAMEQFISWCGLELPFNGVALSADEAKVSTPGTTITYTVSITNTGNVTDLFNLSLSGNDWTSELSLPSVTLDAGETASFTVAVTIPDDALAGEMDNVTVTATSATDGTVTDTAALTTTVEITVPTFNIFIPIIYR